MKVKKEMKKTCLIFCIWMVIFVCQKIQAQEWRRYPTSHYLILSQLGPNETSYVARMMETIYREYSHRFTFPQKPKGRFILKIFRNKKNVQAYLKSIGGSPHWLGAYIRSKKELVVSFGQSRMAFRSLLFHEGFHQFLEYYIPSPPVWFNEGLAEYFGYGLPQKNGKFKFGKPIIPHLNRLVRASRAKSLPLIGKVVGAPHQAFHNPAVEKIYYAKSWLLVHYLISRKRRAFNQLLTTLIGHKTMKYADILGPARTLEKKLQKYMDVLLAKSGEFLYQDGRRSFLRARYARALLKFTQAISKNPYHVRARHDRGLIHFRQKNYPAAIRDFDRVIQMGYDWPATYYYRGLSHWKVGKKKEARLDLVIARSLDPQNPRIQEALNKIR